MCPYFLFIHTCTGTCMFLAANTSPELLFVLLAIDVGCGREEKNVRLHPSGLQAASQTNGAQ